MAYIPNMALRHFMFFMIGFVAALLIVQAVKYFSKDKSEIEIQTNGQKVLLKAV